MSPSLTGNSKRSWKVILLINLALSLFLLLLSLTNLSLPGTWLNYAAPPILGMIALTLLLRFLLPPVTKKLRLLAAASSFPAIGCGCLPSLLMLCMILPPFTLALMFAVGEMAGEQRIQSAVSPDRTRVAEVYFRGVGAYSGGNGRITVRVHARFLPFLEWEVYQRSKSYASEDSHDYLSWMDNRTLLISEDKQQVPANKFYFLPDPGWVVPIILVQWVVRNPPGN